MNTAKGNNWIVQPVLLSHSINWSNPITSVQWPTTMKVGKENDYENIVTSRKS